MPLDVCVIGAGIAGLSAAVALRQGGHRVTVVEKSGFATEVGAALAVAPNGARVLAALGFSFDRALALDLPAWETVDGRSLAQLSTVDLRPAAALYGHPMRSIHRVDLHKELLRLAFNGDDDGGEGDGAGGGGGAVPAPGTYPVTLKLAAPVKSVDAVQGKVVLEDGTTYSTDLIVGADGLHSVARREVVGGDINPPKPVLNAFRFLVPTERLEAEESLRSLREWKKDASTIFVDTKARESQRHVVWYGCHGGKIQNLVGIHPPRSDTEDGKADTDFRAKLLDEFSEFHPNLLKLLSLGENVKCWPLSHYEPFPSWHSGKVVLIGDAAHPMLPLGGQAANQALEDAGALGYFSKGLSSADDVPEMLRRFESVRLKRGSMIQLLSSSMVNREHEVRDKLMPFAEDGYLVPSNFQERNTHANSFDIFERCRQVCQYDNNNTKE